MADKSIDFKAGGLSVRAVNADSLKTLEDSLADPVNFGRFAIDPKGFANSFGVHIDQDISDRLKEASAGKSSLDELIRSPGGGGHPCTAFAVVPGVLAPTSSKIAAVY